VIVPLDKPIKQTGHLQILWGNLAPEGSVAKITGKEGLYFQGEGYDHLVRIIWSDIHALFMMVTLCNAWATLNFRATF
jgi:hypothetical protein